MTTPDICIYHANCDDGFAAAYAVWKRFGDAVEYFPCNHGEDAPDVTDKDVLIVDFSFKRDVMIKMSEQAKRIIVLDHHKTAEAELNGFLNLWPVGRPLMENDMDRVTEGVAVHFDMEKSGCRLAWEYCFGNDPMPDWFIAIEDRDLWKFKFAGTKEISAAIRSFPREFHVWDEFEALNLLNQGVAIRRYVNIIVNNICTTSFEEEIAGYMIPVAACSYDFVSEVAHELLLRNPNAPFAACIIRSYDGTTYSMRSMDDRMDVSEIAKSKGGGGHRNAAGFRVTP